MPPEIPTDKTIEEPLIIPETNLLPEPTIIPETNAIPTTQLNVSFTSPSLATNNRKNLLQNTPDPNNIITPESTPTDKEDDNGNNRGKVTPKTKKQLREEYKIFKAKKLTTQLQQAIFCDIGKLINATNDERVTIIALSMYDRLGSYNPSNELVTNYKHKDVIDMYKKNIGKETDEKQYFTRII